MKYLTVKELEEIKNENVYFYESYNEDSKYRGPFVIKTIKEIGSGYFLIDFVNEKSGDQQCILSLKNGYSCSFGCPIFTKDL